MLKYIFIFLFSIRCISSFGQHSMIIQGNVVNGDGHKIYLANAYNGMTNSKFAQIDSISILNGTFSFQKKFDGYSYNSIALDSLSNFVPFVTDTGIIVFNATAEKFWKADLENSVQNNWKKELSVKTNSIIIRRSAAVDSVMKYDGDSVKATPYFSLYKSITKEWENILTVFIQKHPNCYAAFDDVNKIGDTPEDLEWQKKVFPLFSSQIKNSSQGKQLFYTLYKYSTDSIKGRPFPVVKAYDIKKGFKKISLNSKDVYLIDYWASWCIPCIEKLPALKSIYNKYKEKGFNIISFSLDNNYQSWVNAIKKYQIPWENYSALNGFDSDDARYFNITSIPYTVLVGKGNRIIKLNPTEKEIEEYLETQ